MDMLMCRLHALIVLSLTMVSLTHVYVQYISRRKVELNFRNNACCFFISFFINAVALSEPVNSGLIIKQF